MQTTVTMLVEHKGPIPTLADLIAQRAWTLQGVNNVTVIPVAQGGVLQATGVLPEDAD